ncbi:phage holin family protein [Tepidibacillus sp. LV47]|uniref:phage holin family protein n=1 Tax=Tepidibacillus sp. LV47 TaxID=3398228 RepID=UPI003AB01B98
MTIIRHIIRFAVAALVLLFVGAIVPNFVINGFWNAFLAALVIAVLGWIIEAIFGENVSPFSRGIVGFLTSALVIYLTQFFIPGVRVTVVGALIAALVIGIIDLFVPIKRKFTGEERS